MQIRVLGPLDASIEDRSLSLGGAKQRAVLAMLVLDANRTVSADRLIEGLWGDDVPASAPKMLQNYIWRLRGVLAGDGGAEIVTHGRGYELRIDPALVDVNRLERLVAEAGRNGGGAAREALALFRGDPLADLADEPFAMSEIRRLDELRLSAQELALNADLAAGRHEAVIGDIEALLARSPLRERLHGLRMLALYRCGRQAEALEAYGEARRTLVEQIGVEPGPELRRLHQAILRAAACGSRRTAAAAGSKAPSRALPRMRSSPSMPSSSASPATCCSGSPARARAARSSGAARPLSELAGADEVVARLTDRRLLTTGDGAVEVAHEALLREWPRLRAWLDEDVHGRRLHRQISDAANAWEADAHDPGPLYRGARLSAALEWRAAHEAELNAGERAFLDAGRAAAERANRRLRVVLGAVSLLLVAAVLAGLSHSKNVARRARASGPPRRSDSARWPSRSRRSIARCCSRARRSRSTTTRRRSNTMLAALLRSPAAIRVMRGDGGRMLAVAVRPDGAVVVAGDNAGRLMIFDAAVAASSPGTTAAARCRRCGSARTGRAWRSSAGQGRRRRRPARRDDAAPDRATPGSRGPRRARAHDRVLAGLPRAGRGVSPVAHR